jgi:GH35 family endo-1,4-beta-xylanase
MVLFPNDVPDWFDETATWEDLEYLVEVVVNYAVENDIDQLVVVGEATYCFNDEYCDPYFKLFGMDYIVRAFEMTREMYPEAKLIYEDGFNHVPGSIATEKTMEIANLLHEKGLIDYVGLEMHIDENSIPEKEALIALIDDYPVPVIMTSFTAQLNYLPENQRDEMMNEITETVFDTCLESSRCSSISTWGESDKECWENRSVLFDENIKRKSAYYIAMQSMYLHLNSD